MSNDSTTTEDNLPVGTTQHFAVLPLSSIDDPAMPMRSNLDNENIGDLVMSIKQVGLLEPIVVTPRGDRYEVVAGHRRITACQLGGLTEVPCHVVTGSENQIEMMKIHENLVRQEVNPYDEATHYARLIDVQKITPGKIAQMTNRGETYVRNRLKILQMDGRLQEALASGQLKLNVAMELHRIPDPTKLGEMMHYAIGHGVTGQVAKKWVDEQLPENRPTIGVIPDGPAYGQPVPASEQTTPCFYCLSPVRLWDASSVYVHAACQQQREQQADAEPEQPAE